MYCSECGNKIQEGSKFCPNCGAKQSVQEITNQELPETPQQEQADSVNPVAFKPSRASIRIYFA